MGNIVLPTQSEDTDLLPDSQAVLPRLKQIIRSADGNSDEERFNKVLELLDHPEAANMLGCLQSYTILGLAYVFSRFMGVYIDSREIVIWIIVLLYIVLPDLMPGPVDDLIVFVLLSKLSTTFTEVIRGFAEHVLTLETPLSIRIGKNEIALPQNAWKIIRDHAHQVQTIPKQSVDNALTATLALVTARLTLARQGKAVPRQQQ